MKKRWGQKSVDFLVSKTLPPDVKVMPKDIPRWRDGELARNNPELFTDTLDFALYLIEEDDNHLLLDALRKKWPESVGETLPEVRWQVEMIRKKWPEAVDVSL